MSRSNPPVQLSICREALIPIFCSTHVSDLMENLMILAKSMVLFTAAFLTFSAYASGVSGKVTNVSVRNDGLIWFSVSPVSGARTALPPCVAAYAQSLFTVPNEGTSTAKQQLAIL